MTEPDDVLLGRAEIERAFTALGERLVRRGVIADVFVVGGAAMALAYDAARVTRDVDAVLKISFHNFLCAERKLVNRHADRFSYEGEHESDECHDKQHGRKYLCVAYGGNVAIDIFQRNHHI